MGGKSRRNKRNRKQGSKHVNLKRKRVKLKNLLNKQAITAKILAKRKHKQQEELQTIKTQNEEEKFIVHIEKRLHI